MYVSKSGIIGDRVLNSKHHGGPDQAVYGYRIEDYRWWAKELGYPVEAGAFGENLTLEGLGSAALPIGSHLHFEQVVLEVMMLEVGERVRHVGLARKERLFPDRLAFAQNAAGAFDGRGDAGPGFARLDLYIVAGVGGSASNA